MARPPKAPALQPGRRLGGWGSAGLLILIVLAFILNFAEGVALGQRDTLFYPMYRTRQTLAVALSMLREPPATGYLAYGSMVNSLKSSGLFIAGDEGIDADEDADAKRREALFRDPVAINRAISEALQVPIDASQPAETIRANDLGYADYMYLAFRVFGPKVSSLYDLYFVLLLVSACAFIVQFYRDKFMLLLLSVYMAVHLFVLEYCHGFSAQIGSIANSRTFSGLALLPAIHLAAMLLLGKQLGVRFWLTALVQSLLLSFLVLCRFEAVWELGAVFLTAALVAFWLVLKRWAAGDPAGYRRLSRLWPAAILLLAFFAMQARQDFNTSPIYGSDSKKHVVWHATLFGLLSAEPGLIPEYTGIEGPSADEYVYDDRVACEAVNYLVRQQRSSTESHTGQYDCDAASNLFGGGAGDYDRLARAVVLRIVGKHPGVVLTGFGRKFEDQVEQFNTHAPFVSANLIVPVILILLATAVYAASGGIVLVWRRVPEALMLVAIISGCALITPMIAPSILAIGTLASLLIVGALLVCGAILIGADGLLRLPGS